MGETGTGTIVDGAWKLFFCFLPILCKLARWAPSGNEDAFGKSVQLHLLKVLKKILGRGHIGRKYYWPKSTMQYIGRTHL